MINDVTSGRSYLLSYRDLMNRKLATKSEYRHPTSWVYNCLKILFQFMWFITKRNGQIEPNPYPNHPPNSLSLALSWHLICTNHIHNRPIIFTILRVLAHCLSRKCLYGFFCLWNLPADQVFSFINSFNTSRV